MVGGWLVSLNAAPKNDVAWVEKPSVKLAQNCPLTNWGLKLINFCNASIPRQQLSLGRE